MRDTEESRSGSKLSGWEKVNHEREEIGVKRKIRNWKNFPDIPFQSHDPDHRGNLSLHGERSFGRHRGIPGSAPGSVCLHTLHRDGGFAARIQMPGALLLSKG